jgi:hypothetical protein
MLDSVIRDWLEPSPLHPLRAMSGNMWALHPSRVIIYLEGLWFHFRGLFEDYIFVW